MRERYHGEYERYWPNACLLEETCTVHLDIWIGCTTVILDPFRLLHRCHGRSV